MASVIWCLPCRTEATFLALRQLRYSCCFLAGSWFSRLVKRVGHQSRLPKRPSRLVRPSPILFPMHDAVGHLVGKKP